MEGLVKEVTLFDGVQKLYRFDNKYGASVVRHCGSYGHEEGLWELGVIRWYSDTEWHLCYSTPIADDAIGWLTDENVTNLLSDIKNLPEN